MAYLLSDEKPEVDRLDTRRSNSHVRDVMTWSEAGRITEGKSGLENPSILTVLPSGPRLRSHCDWALGCSVLSETR
jgi:hypothetical protein